MRTGGTGGEVAMTRAEAETGLPWWLRIPLDRVVRLDGATARDLAASVDPLPGDGPVTLFFALSASSATHLVDAVVDALETAAAQLAPQWLPGVSDDDRSTLTRSAAQARAQEMASTTDHFGPYVAHLADSYVSGHAPRAERFSRDVRMSGARRVVISAHGRESALLMIDVPHDADPDMVSAAAEWLCSTGIGIALVGHGAARVQRFPSIRVDTPPAPRDVTTVVDRFRPLSYPPVLGRPHPASPAERYLYELLNGRTWAVGRGHNRVVQLTALHQPFTVDVLWTDDRVVVEIDGPEHRAAQMFSADRSRDNLLQTHGYLVLRFANDDVLTDHEHVLATIEQALRRRRSKGTTT
ncbi:MAG: DUF559 domain-containing protein [Rhodococcus sp. (in: high G+C Gram-positive bacteria)]